MRPRCFLLGSVPILGERRFAAQRPLVSRERGYSSKVVIRLPCFLTARIASIAGRLPPDKAHTPAEPPSVIVNAVAHRDYASSASVQVMLFADRLEVWNPGELPPSLTLAQLRVPHASIPHNPLISEPLFLAHYVERAGTGTLDMIALCREAGLPEPDFRQDGGQFVQTLWRDWLTGAVLSALALSSRQTEAVRHLKMHGQITNAESRTLTGLTPKTAARDLDDLGVLTS